MTADTTNRKLMCLTMIVKNEARTIRRSIESLAGQADCIAILDTGSTDGTKVLAEEAGAAAGVPTVVASGPFVDFADARNRSLKLAEETFDAAFAFVLSGDEWLIDEDKKLIEFAFDHLIDASGSSHNVQVEFNKHRFDQTRLVRLGAGWQYRGAVHEALVRDGSPPVTSRVPGAYVFHDAENVDGDRRRRRMYRDLEILQEQIRVTPDDTRVQFYLAQTLEDLGYTEQAHEAYARRVRMGGWNEEQYEAAFRMGRTGLFMGKTHHQLVELHLAAHAIDPRRAEPIYSIAYGYRFQAAQDPKFWTQCWLFASYGAAIPYPTECRLFVDSEVYSYKLADLAGISGFHTGHFELGEKYAQQAAAAKPDDQRIQRNLKLYVDRKAS